MVANGDLTIVLEKRSDQDALMISLNHMVTKMSAIILEFKKTAEQISTVSFEISGGAQQLSQGANEQASSSEELATTSEKLANQSEQLHDLIEFFKVQDDVSPFKFSADHHRGSNYKGNKNESFSRSHPPVSVKRTENKGTNIDLRGPTPFGREDAFEKY